MQYKNKVCSEFSAALSNYAQAVAAARAGDTAWTRVVDICSQLPLTQVAVWEGMIRNEYCALIDRLPKKIWQLPPSRPRVFSYLDVMSWNGYRREQALNQLSKHQSSKPVPNAFLFYLVLRRLNDWVPEVREAAKRCVLTLAQTSDSSIVADAVAMALLRRVWWLRADEDHLNLLLCVVRQPQIAHALKHKITTSPTGPMASVLSHLGRVALFDNDLPNIAATAIQPVVRARAYRYLFEKRMCWVVGYERGQCAAHHFGKQPMRAILDEREITVTQSFSTLFHQSSRDSSVIVRRIAAEFLVRRYSELGSHARAFAEQLTADRCSDIAERGRYVLKKLDTEG